MEIGLKHKSSGEYFPFDRTQVCIGSDPRCEVVIERASVAPRHAEIRITRLGIELDDLGSATGTYVNDYKVDRHFLSNGDILKLGSEVFELEFHTEARGRRSSTEAGIQPDVTRRVSRSILEESGSRLFDDSGVVARRRESGSGSGSGERLKAHLDRVSKGTQRFDPRALGELGDEGSEGGNATEG